MVPVTAAALLPAFVAPTGHRTARSVPTGRLRALAHAGAVVTAVTVAQFGESLVGH